MRKAELEKKWQKSSNEYESERKIVIPFSQFWEITLKQVYNICLNEIG